jgi:hypothetical protein
MPWLLLIGHIIGDYWLQTKWMAQSKIRPDAEGYLACFIHCFFYSLAITIFMSPVLPGSKELLIMFCIAFACHFPIDKFSLAKFFLKHVLNSPKPTLTLIHEITPDILTQHIIWWIVYIIIDNSAHLFLMSLCITTLFTVNSNCLILR